MNQANKGEKIDVLGKRLLVLARMFSSSPTQKWATWLRSPLDGAARVGDFAFVNTILHAGADASSAGLDDDCVAGPSDRKTNLIASAAFGGNPRVVSALIAAGSRDGINMADTSTGEHPLHIAAGRGHRTVVKLLLHLGAEVNAQVACCPGSNDQQGSKHSVRGYRLPSPRQGMTALHFAALLGHWEIVVDLIMHGADTDVILPESQESPMHLAARRGHHTAVGALLAAGALPTVLSRRNLFPMDLAACHNHSSTVREFLEYGIDPNTKNALGYTALHQAAYHNAAEALETLVGAGGNLNAATKNGHTPLHVAAFSSTPSSSDGGKSCHDARAVAAAAAVRTIGKYSAVDIDATDASGATPLHTACTHLRERAVEELLKMGANVSLVHFTSSGNEATIAARNSNPGGVARVRAMLTAARAEATWRRRGWLVVLRTRALALARQKHRASSIPPAGTAALGNMSGKRARQAAVGSGDRGGGGGESPRGKRCMVGGRYLPENRRSSSSQRGRGSEVVRAWGGSDWGEVSAARGGGGGWGVELLSTAVGRTTVLQDVTVFRKIVAFL